MERKNFGWLFGTGIGAGLMYLLDPRMGRRRRALAKDKLTHYGKEAGHAMSAAVRDASNRARGIVHEGRQKFAGMSREDRRIAESVRAQLGRASRHPSAIDVHVRDGVATLTGHVLAAEIDDLLDAVRAVGGVYEVDNRLQAHEQPDSLPSLQGEGRRGSGLAHESWVPGARMTAAAAGGALFYYAAQRGGALGLASGAAGAGLIVRALTNLDAKRLTGLGAGRKAIQIDQAVRIDLPVDQVFQLWSDFENFPLFMSHVREVRKSATEGKSHWVVDGPAGIPVEWDAVMTELEPNRKIAWKTLSAFIKHEGAVRFEPQPDGSTMVSVRLNYNPGAGAAGHALAKMLGADPAKQMQDDLARMKRFLESGTRPRDAAAGS